MRTAILFDIFPTTLTDILPTRHDNDNRYCPRHDLDSTMTPMAFGSELCDSDDIGNLTGERIVKKERANLTQRVDLYHKGLDLLVSRGKRTGTPDPQTLVCTVKIIVASLLVRSLCRCPF